MDYIDWAKLLEVPQLPPPKIELFTIDGTVVRYIDGWKFETHQDGLLIYTVAFPPGTFDPPSLVQ